MDWVLDVEVDVMEEDRTGQDGRGGDVELGVRPVTAAVVSAAAPTAEE